MTSKVLKVALTGGIASGKSLVSDLLEIHGCKIIDLDIISREVVMPGTEGLRELVDTFGKSILLSDDSLDRKNLRDELYKKGRNAKKLLTSSFRARTIGCLSFRLRPLRRVMHSSRFTYKRISCFDTIVVQIKIESE